MTTPIAITTQQYAIGERPIFTNTAEPITLIHMTFEGDEGSTNFIDLTGRHSPYLPYRYVSGHPATSDLGLAHITTKTSNTGSSSLHTGWVDDGQPATAQDGFNGTRYTWRCGIEADQDGHPDWGLGFDSISIKVSFNMIRNSYANSMLVLTNSTYQSTYFTLSPSYPPNSAGTFRSGYMQVGGFAVTNNSELLPYVIGKWTTIEVRRTGKIIAIYQDNKFVTGYYNTAANIVNVISSRLVIGSGNPSGSLNNVAGCPCYMDDLIIKKPVTLMEMDFSNNSPTPIHSYVDNMNRHTFIEEGIVAVTNFPSPFFTGSLDARVGNIITDGNSRDFYFPENFHIYMFINHLGSQTNRTFWTIYDADNMQILSLKMTPTKIQLTGYNGIIIDEVTRSITGWNFYGVIRLNGYIRLQINPTAATSLFTSTAGNGEVIYVPYKTSINGKYMRIGGTGAGCNSYIDYVHISKG